MLFDLQSLFSDQQDFGGNAGTAVPSTNVIDLGAVDTPEHAVGPITRDLGRGRPIPIHIQVTETFVDDGGNDFTALTVALQIDDAEGFGTAETVLSQTFAQADLVVGKRLPPFYIPEGVDKRYVRLLYTPVGGGLDAGKITAGLVFGRSNWTT